MNYLRVTKALHADTMHMYERRLSTLSDVLTCCFVYIGPLQKVEIRTKWVSGEIIGSTLRNLL